MAFAVRTSSVALHGVSRGVRQIVRDRSWGTTLLLLSALMLLMQFLVVFVIGVYGTNTFLISQASLQLEILPSASTTEVQELNAALRAQPFVQSVEFVTSEEAFKREKERDPDLIQFLSDYKLENPFPSIFLVTLRTLQSYDEFTGFVQQAKWRNVVNSSYLSSVTDQEEQARLLLSVTESVGTFSFVSIAVAFALLCFVILEWVMRAMTRRRDELQLEYLLGASPLSMVVPYATEMGVLLMIATLIAMAVTVGFLLLFPLFFPALAYEETFTHLRSAIVPMFWLVLPSALLIELVFMPLLSFGGAFFGVRSTLGNRAVSLS